MKITLLNYTKNPEETVAQAAKLCYSTKSIDQIAKSISEEKPDKIIAKIIKLGHFSVLEHVSFTFGIEGISRVTSHQLVRHRLASFSQKSQRYTRIEKKGQFIIPEKIKSDSDFFLKFQELSNKSFLLYQEMLTKGIPAEDARYILPQAITTSIIFTANARELMHFFRLRCCNRAQWEIREMAIEMLKIVKEIAPHIFATAGPPCLIGPCPEGEMSCGNPWTKANFKDN